MDEVLTIAGIEGKFDSEWVLIAMQFRFSFDARQGLTIVRAELTGPSGGGSRNWLSTQGLGSNCVD